MTAPASTAAAAENPSTGQLRRICSCQGEIPSGSSALTASTPQADTSTARPPPTAARIRLSAREWRRMRARLAPKARRTPISRRRPSPRTSCRFATLAHVTSSTQPTAPSSSQSARCAPRPTTVDPNGCSPRCQPRYRSGRVWASPAETVSSTACSLRRPAAPPADNRPMVTNLRWLDGCISGLASLSGNQTSQVNGVLKPCGMTPTTVQDRSLSVTRSPTISAAAWNCVRQSSSLRTTAGGLSGRQSAGRKVRPRWGSTPNTRKKSAVTKPTVSCAGVAIPVRLL